MDTEPPWNSRWRSESHYQGHYFDRTQAPQAPVPSIGNHQPSPKLPSTVDTYSKPWDSSSRGDPEQSARGVSSMIDCYADASTYHSRLHERHTSPGRDSRLTTSPPRHNMNQAWQSLPVDHHALSRRISDAPLTLHIPQTQGTYYISSSVRPLQVTCLQCLFYLPYVLIASP